MASRWLLSILLIAPCAPTYGAAWEHLDSPLFQREYQWENIPEESVCSLITMTEVQMALGAPVANPIDTTSLIIAGWSYADHWGSCEYGTVERDETFGPRKPIRWISLSLWFSPFDLGDWPNFWRGQHRETTPVPGIAQTAFWAVGRGGGQSFFGLYAFEEDTHVMVEIGGFETEADGQEAATAIVQAALSQRHTMPELE